ncbi:MAG: 6-bladed beta-propeller [bacterium]|nr:6-bladed beta-propeller [bacterium]
MSAANLPARLSILPITLLCLMLLSSTPPVQAAWRGTMTESEEGLLVNNPAEAAEAPVTIELEELWRVGGDTDDDDEFFGVICDVLRDDGGEVYLLDRQLSQVNVFDSDGGFLRIIGREGEGPGEFRDPSSIFHMPTGELGIVQTRPGGIVLLERDGQPGRLFSLPRSDDGGMRRIQAGDSRGGNIVIWGMNFRRKDDTFTRMRMIMGLDSEGEMTCIYDQTLSEVNMARRVIAEDDGFNLRWALGPDGRVFVNDDFGYRLQVWNADGTPDRIIGRDYELEMRSQGQIDEKRDQIRERYQSRGRGRRRPRTSNLEVEVSPHRQSILWFSIDDHGNTWLLSGRGARDLPEGVLCLLDVYDSEGRFIQEVTLRGEGDIREDRLVLRGDRLFQLTDYQSAMDAMRGREDEDVATEEDYAEPMSVICYRFAWQAP